MFSGCCAPGDEPGESVRQLSDMLQDQQVCKLLRRASECLKHLKTLADFRKKYENLAEQLTPNSQPSPEFVFLRLVQFLSDTEWYKGLCVVYVWSMCLYISIYFYICLYMSTWFTRFFRRVQQKLRTSEDRLGGSWIQMANMILQTLHEKNMKILF